MPASMDRAGQLLAHLASLEVGQGSDVAAARDLAQMEPAEAVHALRVLIAQAKRSQRAGRALVCAARALQFGPDTVLPAAQRSEIFSLAVELGWPEVAALFVVAEPAQVIDPLAAEPADPSLAAMTLGHKKMIARRADPDRIARLAAECDARVLRELLLNPRLTEETVVRVVARRPAKASALLEIWRSPKWSVRATVRKALAMNPYTPPEIALKIIPVLLAADQRAIAGDATLHPSVRELARRLSSPGAAP